MPPALITRGESRSEIPYESVKVAIFSDSDINIQIYHNRRFYTSQCIRAGLNISCLCSGWRRLTRRARYSRKSLFLRASTPSAKFYYLHSPLPHVHYVLLARHGRNDTLYRALRPFSDFRYHPTLESIPIQEIFGSFTPSVYQSRLLRYNPTGSCHDTCLDLFARPQSHYIGRDARELMFTHRHDYVHPEVLESTQWVNFVQSINEE